MWFFCERVGTHIVLDLPNPVSRFPLSLVIGGCSANDLEPVELQNVLYL